MASAPGFPDPDPKTPPTETPADGRPGEPAKPPASFGPMSEHHWSKARVEHNQEAMEYLRWRSHAPGVESGGAERNHYCMHCHGVIPLQYDQRQPADGTPSQCPHCGAALEPRVRAMFNWVEMDQPPAADTGLKWALFALVLGGIALGLAIWLLL